VKKAGLLLAVMVLVLAACGPGPYAIREGTLHDTIFSVEPRMNGTTTVWFTHDDVGAYCTKDPEISALVSEIVRSNNTEVVATYRSLNRGDAEYGSLFGTDGCAKEDDANTIYLLLTVERVPQDE
jgi:hypothetical protein